MLGNKGLFIYLQVCLGLYGKFSVCYLSIVIVQEGIQKMSIKTFSLKCLLYICFRTLREGGLSRVEASRLRVRDRISRMDDPWPLFIECTAADCMMQFYEKVSCFGLAVNTPIVRLGFVLDVFFRAQTYHP